MTALEAANFSALASVTFFGSFGVASAADSGFFLATVADVVLDTYDLVSLSFAVTVNRNCK